MKINFLGKLDIDFIYFFYYFLEGEVAGGGSQATKPNLENLKASSQIKVNVKQV